MMRLSDIAYSTTAKSTDGKEYRIKNQNTNRSSTTPPTTHTKYGGRLHVLSRMYLTALFDVP